jgi:hypothetical protein
MPRSSGARSSNDFEERHLTSPLAIAGRNRLKSKAFSGGDDAQAAARTVAPAGPTFTTSGDADRATLGCMRRGLMRTHSSCGSSGASRTGFCSSSRALRPSLRSTRPSASSSSGHALPPIAGRPCGMAATVQCARLSLISPRHSPVSFPRDSMKRLNCSTDVWSCAFTAPSEEPTLSSAPSGA